MNMTSPPSYQPVENLEDDVGCAYVLEEPNGRHTCGAMRKLSSSYCPHHHALCHIACGTKLKPTTCGKSKLLQAPWVDGARDNVQSLLATS